jgi:hypothetical protein
LHIIDNTWVDLIIFFSKKTDMKFIILVSNLKEILPSVFSWKKEYIKNYDPILLSKYDSAEKKILNYAYVLKNGVGRYSIFFNFCTKLAESSFLCRFRIESVNVFRFHDSMCFLHQQTISHMRKRFPEWVHCQVVWILRR